MTTLENAALSESDFSDLKKAKKILEYPGLVANLSSLIGSPIEKGIEKLPENWKKNMVTITESILMKALEFAIYTLGDTDTKEAHKWMNKALVSLSGAAGGAIGLASIPIEMPISTAIFLRGIADVARSEGHDISLLSTRLDCLSVLALGGESKKDEASETGYWSIRMSLNKVVPETVEKIITNGAGKHIAEKFAKLISVIAGRFSIIITEEAAARSIPLVVGSAVGGTINFLFMSHFQDMARGHFIIRRLEKEYGVDFIRTKYEEIDI